MTLTKEQAERNKELLKEILEIVLDTNGVEGRNREETGTLPTVFLEFSGHVGELRVDIHRSGWGTGSRCDNQFRFYTYKPIPETLPEEIRKYCEECLTDRNESEVLAEDIKRAEEEIMLKKKELAAMKRNKRQLERKGL